MLPFSLLTAKKKKKDRRDVLLQSPGKSPLPDPQFLLLLEAMASEKIIRTRNGKNKDGTSAGAVNFNGSSGDVNDRRPPQCRPPLPLLLPRLLSFLSRLARSILAKLLPASFLSSWRRIRKWRSTRLRGRAFGAALAPDDDDDDEQTADDAAAADEQATLSNAGLAALRLANCRDLASACIPQLIAPGRLFRSASPFAVGGGGEEAASEEAAAAAAARALAGASASGFHGSSSSSSSSRSRSLNLALVIDLRSANEWETGRGDDVLRALARLSETEKKSKSENNADEPLRVERVPLQEWKRYTYAFVARLPPTRCLGAAAHFFLLRHVLRFEPPIPGMHARLCADAERGGLVAMNTTVLAAFSREIARVLRLISQHASSSPPSSVMVACKLGKDRTGLVSALCLAVAGASRREIVRDYARSAEGLAGRPPPATAPSLGGAPGAAMERTLDWLWEHFARFADEAEVERYRQREEERRRGSGNGRRRRGGGPGGENRVSPSLRPPCSPCWRAGVLGYLESEALFLAGEREALRRALTE